MPAKAAYLFSKPPAFGMLIFLLRPMENLRSALTKATSNQIIESAQVHQILEPP